MLWFRLSLLAIAAATPQVAEDWSRFRGPDGSGIVPRGQYPTAFSKRNVVWKSSVPAGKSSPVLTESAVFLTAQRDGEFGVLCFERRNGRLRWERYLKQARSEFQHPLNAAASSTPATDGQNVYAFFGNFGLISFAPDGKERWRVPLGPFSSVWGMAASPVLASGKVILLLDGFGSSYIAAFHARTGKQVWKVERPPFAMNYSTPVVRKTVRGEEEIITLGPGRATAYDLDTGEVRWTSELPSGVIVASPALAGDVLVALTYSLEAVPAFDEELQKSDRNGDGRITHDEFGSGEHGRVLQTFGTMYGNRDGTIERAEWVSVWNQWVGRPAVTAVTTGHSTSSGGALRWRYERNVPRVPTPLLLNGIVYVVASGGILTALDVTTGTPLKAGRLPGALDNYYSSPVAAGNTIYLASEAGKIVTLQAGREWSVINVSDVEEECFATPALSRGQVLIRTKQTLWLFGEGSGPHELQH